MNLLCPNCQKMIQVLEQYAGQTVRCPLCAGTFPVPVLPPTSAPAAAPHPPVDSADVIPFQASAPATSTATAPRPGPENGPGARPESASRTAAASAPEPSATFQKAAARSTAPETGANAVYAKSAPLPTLTPGYQHLHSIWISPRVVKWIPLGPLGVVFLTMFSTWILVIGKPDDWMTGWQTAFGGHYTAAGLFFALFLLLAMLLAVAAVVVPRLSPEQVPPAVHQVLPWSSAIVAGVIAFAFLFLLLEFAAGFGVQDSPTVGTAWMRLALWALIVAFVGAVLDVWLTIRGEGLPLPRIDISW